MRRMIVAVSILLSFPIFGQIHWSENGREIRFDIAADSLNSDTSWYENRQMHSVRVTGQAPRNGYYDSYQEWDSAGTLVKLVYQSDNIDTTVEYYDNGQLQERIIQGPTILLLNGGNNIYWCEEYYENGQPKHTTNSMEGPYSKTTFYYSSGNKQRVCFGGYGMEWGPDTCWYQNGKIKSTTSKELYSQVYSKRWHCAARRIGSWSSYNESGKLIKEEFYEEGKLVKAIEY